MDGDIGGWFEEFHKFRIFPVVRLFGGVWIRIEMYTSNEIWSKAWQLDLVAH
jgi:hypothetical protein